MTRYNDELWNLEGGVDEMIQDAHRLGYREGVDRVLEYIESIHRYHALEAELKWAIEEGII